MIVITGAAGFIASALLGTLNKKGVTDIVIVDDFSKEQKSNNWQKKRYTQAVDRNNFLDWFRNNAGDVDFVFHIGARTDTTEFDWNVFVELNLEYTKGIWEICAKNYIPMIYASSAATYGDGSLGYRDSHDIVEQLQPLNPYGRSKNEFDKWALKQEKQPPFWAGLKFFNVYGPNEYHKGRMASVILHTFETVRKTGKMQLFRSHNPNFEDGMQLRDFVYVKDVVSVILHLFDNKPESGLYNVGTGHAQSFLDLANSTFEAMGLEPNIEFIDMPLDIRDKYQYFTEADISKLRSTGYDKPFHNLSQGVADYVKNYLIPNKYI